jgi:hypothetical protein
MDVRELVGRLRWRMVIMITIERNYIDSLKKT